MNRCIAPLLCALLLTAISLPGCGGKPKAPATGAPAANAQAGAQGTAGGVQAAQPGPPAANPRFALIRPYFSQFLRHPVEGKVNIFKRNLAQFAPRIDLDVTADSTSDEPKTPLELYDVENYSVTLIMSGTAMAKALLVDPRGKTYVATAGSKVGNRGGKIVSISSTEIRIEEPGRPATIKVLEPPTTDMIRELQAVQEF